MIPDCDGRSDGQTESIIANTALCIARAMLTRCKNCTKTRQQTEHKLVILDITITITFNIYLTFDRNNKTFK